MDVECKYHSSIGLLNHCCENVKCNVKLFLLCRMPPRCVSSILTGNLMYCTSLLWLSLLPEAVLQHLFMHTP
jgi:hypothetical protein